jgi:hypothetical protein
MPAKGQLVAEGTYTIHHGDVSTGRETWQLSKLAHGGLLFNSRAERTLPKPSTCSFTFEITQRWSPVLFAIRFDADGKVVTSEQRAEGTQWRAHVEPRGEQARDHTLDFSAKHAVSFASPLSNAVTLVRLNLQVGRSHEVDVIVIDLPTLEPRADRQKYVCTAEEKIEVPAGSFSAWHYTTSTNSAQSENHFWADRHGIVLLCQTADGDVMKLARYRRIEPR